MYEVHQPYTLIFISFIHPPLSSGTSLSHTIPILQSCLSLLIFKLVFKGVSQCTPAVGVLYFGPFNPFHCSPLPLYLPPSIFQQLSVHILVSSTFTDVMFYDITDVLSFFSFPSFPQFHRVVPLLQTCSTSEFVYNHVCFYVYICLLDLSSMYERKHVAFVFLSLASFT
jgi:hypothetical protein